MHGHPENQAALGAQRDADGMLYRTTIPPVAPGVIWDALCDEMGTAGAVGVAVELLHRSEHLSRFIEDNVGDDEDWPAGLFFPSAKAAETFEEAQRELQALVGTVRQVLRAGGIC